MEKHFQHGATIFRGITGDNGIRKSISRQLNSWLEQQSFDFGTNEVSYRVSFERKAPGHDVFCQAEIHDGDDHLWTSAGAGVTAHEALACCLKNVQASALEASTESAAFL